MPLFSKIACLPEILKGATFKQINIHHLLRMNEASSILSTIHAIQWPTIITWPDILPYQKKFRTVTFKKLNL